MPLQVSSSQCMCLTSNWYSISPSILVWILSLTLEVFLLPFLLYLLYFLRDTIISHLLKKLLSKKKLNKFKKNSFSLLQRKKRGWEKKFVKRLKTNTSRMVMIFDLIPTRSSRMNLIILTNTRSRILILASTYIMLFLTLKKKRWEKKWQNTHFLGWWQASLTMVNSKRKWW